MREMISIPQNLALLMNWLDSPNRPMFDGDSFLDLFVDALGHTRERPIGVRAHEFAVGCSEGQLLSSQNTYTDRERIWIFNEIFRAVVETQALIARLGYYGVTYVNGVLTSDDVEFTIASRGPGFLIISGW